MSDSVATRSPLEEARFGVRTARASVKTVAEVEEALRFCRENRVELLIARCEAADTHILSAMERRGLLLMETFVVLARDMAKTPIPPVPEGLVVRPLREDEAGAVEAVVRSAFHEYYGHYHADERLDRAKCDETYVDWARRCCLDRKAADEVLVAQVEERVVGFLAMRMDDAEEGQSVLGGVTPAWREHGVFRALALQGLRWCKARGAKRAIVATHLANVATQRAFIAAGYVPRSAYHTFHKWFDD